MSTYDGEPTITVRKAEDVWFRCYCTKCGTYFDGVGTLASIRAEPVFKARCECSDDTRTRQLVEVPRGEA